MPWIDKISRCKRWSDHERFMHNCSCTGIPASAAICTPQLQGKKKILFLLTKEVFKGFRSSPGVR